MLSFVSTYRDRCRTTINVWGDSIGAGIIYERSKDDLKNLPDPFENEDLGKDKGEKDEDLGNDIHLIDMVKMDEDVGKDTNMPKIDEAVGIDIDRKTDEVATSDDPVVVVGDNIITDEAITTDDPINKV